MNPRKLWIYYSAAIAVVVTLLLSSHAIHMNVLSLSAQDEETINISGRQRMLSQRVLLVANELARAYDPVYAGLLASALDTMEDGHSWLLENAVTSPDTRFFYFAPEGPQLDARTRDYIALGRSVLTDASRMTAPEMAGLLRQMKGIALNDLLRDLNAAVALFEAEANRRADTLVKAQKYALLAAIGILLLEAAFIFRPAQRAVTRSLDAVEARNSELKDLSERLEFAAFHDPLTGLGNRKKLQIELAAKLARRKPGEQTVCVMHLDLDGFKAINDTLGHASGDEVLKKVAAILLASAPEDSAVARVGGDEFVIVMDAPETRAADFAKDISDIILRAMEPAMHLGEEQRQVGVSIGYTFADGSGVSGDVMIANADIALYAAKRAGKGVAKSFDEKMRADLEQRESMVLELRRAVFTQEFVPYFQPQISLQTGKVIGLEILARWQHPQKGLLLPGSFLDTADAVGLLDAIEGQLLFAALEDYHAFAAVSAVRPRLSFNASAGTLQDDMFPEALLSVLAGASLQPADIVVEIVESVTLTGEVGDKIARNIAKLRKAGFNIHVDDFGTGYASLENIARLDVTGLKLDRSIIAAMDDPKYQQIAQAVSGLSSSTGLEVVAEGVETQDQVFALRDMGFDTAQGYLFAHPMPRDACLAWLDMRQDIAWIKRAS